MAHGGLEEQTANQDVLQGILATLKRVEQLLSHQNQPYPSNLCESNTDNSAGDKIGNGAGEDDGGLQSSSEKGDGNSEMATEVMSALPHKVCPLIFSETSEILHQEVHRLSIYDLKFDEAAYWHYACEERPRALIRDFTGGAVYTFHTTFFELQNSPAKPGSWASGNLYSFYDSGRKSFRKACITINTSRYKYGPASPTEWAIGVLAPSGFHSSFASFHGGPLNLKFPALDSESPRDTVLQVITSCVDHIVFQWQILYDEVLKECNGENISFMDSEKYVHLLYDDSTFRRFKFYFWAIGCLSSFEQSVAETLWELTTFRVQVDGKSPLGERAASESNGFKEIYNQEMENFDQACKNLEGIHDQLVKKRDEMKTLRDGLFSASGVMESRQSRILGENVQLLAFVTIFFLPLAFSASLWSIPGVNERYPGLTLPGASAAIIAFVTYFIVFNLNLLISGLRRLLYFPRNSLLKRMSSDDGSKNDSEDDSDSSDGSGYSTHDGTETIRWKEKSGKRYWQKKAKAFEVFPPRDDNQRPSNWLLLVYSVRILVIKVFDIAIGMLAWLRAIIASNPSNQDPDTEMADRAIPGNK
ncbi:hypothetical protein V492_06167 [Pseudogymnoascus sp. VKM F-4246]|nr:hypothetical protein V492_06167 [Pseudogymnoascus sp. VKM F-4246]